MNLRSEKVKITFDCAIEDVKFLCSVYALLTESTMYDESSIVNDVDYLLDRFHNFFGDDHGRVREALNKSDFETYKMIAGIKQVKKDGKTTT